MADHENTWDDKIVPKIKLKAERLKYPRSRMNNAQQVLTNMVRKPREASDLAIQLKRSLQLAYIEPWFQMFLPPQLKDKIFICSIGRKFWVIGAVNASYATRFKFAQREIRKSLEAHLNRISKKEWVLPEFKVNTYPDNPTEEGTYLHEIVRMKEIVSVPLQKRIPRTRAQNKKRLDELLKKIDDKIKKNNTDDTKETI